MGCHLRHSSCLLARFTAQKLFTSVPVTIHEMVTVPEPFSWASAVMLQPPEGFVAGRVSCSVVGKFKRGLLRTAVGGATIPLITGDVPGQHARLSRLSLDQQ